MSTDFLWYYANYVHLSVLEQKELESNKYFKNYLTSKFLLYFLTFSFMWPSYISKTIIGMVEMQDISPSNRVKS